MVMGSSCVKMVGGRWWQRDVIGIRVVGTRGGNGGNGGSDRGCDNAGFMVIG